MRAFVAAIAVAVCAVGVMAGTPYSSSEAYGFLDFAAAAYCPGSKIEGWTCDVCSKHPGVKAQVIYDPTTDTQSFVGYEQPTNTLWVVFRGTDPLSIVNWLTDLNFPKKSDYGNACNCQVHEGFMNAYLSVAETVRATIQDMLDNYGSANPKIYVAGHSLGGALAELAALDMVETLHITPDAVYTFGTPRVGDNNFHNYYDQNVPTNFRVTHNADPVPHLPPELFGFHHTATEVFYNEMNTAFTICDGSGEDPMCADGVLIPLLVTDHLTYLGLNFTANFLECNL